MKIQPILSNQINKSYNSNNKITAFPPFLKESDNADSFILNQTQNSNQLPFGMSPVKLNLGKYENKSILTGREAIEIFEKFKNGKYLDLNGGNKSYYDSRTRIENLSFLDKIINTNDKKEFIDYYKNLTGFPDLWYVSYKIKEQFKSAAKKSEANLKINGYYDSSYYEIVNMGYDGVSSVAKFKSLPGSDLDKAYITIKGSSYSESIDNDVVNQFKEQLWENTDQRILSYNHDADSFPKVYTEMQVMNLVDKINDANETLLKILETILIRPTYLGMFMALFEKDEPPEKYDPDYVNANQNFIKLCKKFPIKGNWSLDSSNPSRENIYSFGFIAEAMYRGDLFEGYPNYKLVSSEAIKFFNISQINALKNSSGNKEKYQQRDRLANDFNYWSIDKQFRFIKSLLLASCGEKTEFPEYFASNTENKFMQLMREVGL